MRSYASQTEDIVSVVGPARVEQRGRAQPAAAAAARRERVRRGGAARGRAGRAGRTELGHAAVRRARVAAAARRPARRRGAAVPRPGRAPRRHGPAAYEVSGRRGALRAGV